MVSILVLAVFVGMSHALEADHVLAVSSLAAGKSSMRDIVRHGLTWGFGHTLMLFVCAGAALAMGASIPANFSSGIEALVGVMLVGLGSHVLWQLARNRVHFHSHSHGDGTAHFHAHSHKAEPVVRGKQHRLVYHGHEHGVRWRTLAVGLMHGLAGSGALLVLTVSQMKSVGTGLATIALFGLGSMVGMAVVSGLIAIPLAGTARRLTFANHALQLVIGVATIAMGAATVYARVAA